ncbi:aldo/keto reductase [Aeromicrobium sp. 636]|uniref:Aldo/keto reductase n=1 Tax=Aeromicrobium senzhongii TaxID=2663859 RepID=A0A8I0EUY5_9ACTN|nr:MULTISPECIES: aldo/keto reductase [Aeromicrobium]MBC9225545.1 aldo/keto reductase [Aeromicrobium senzhongii]MCQ3997655.1 aldo/keto reductase [Aeromicrobium sp. 636]
MTVPTLTLNNGVQIPQFGYGTWQVPPETAQDRVAEALDIGYRHIDTAQMYGNEEGVGAAIAASGLARDEVFVTTKLNNNRHDPERVGPALDESLDKLGLERVDLFLIHWPLPMIDIDFVDTWRAMEEAYAAGKARAIGVSNFQPSHLRRVVQEATVVPAVNQIEIHPYFTQDELRAVNSELGIATEAWSPLAQGQVFDDAALEAIARSTGRSVSQVVLRWHLQRGDIVFPKASSVERLKQNFDLFDFELSDADMGAISALDAGRRIGADPDEMSWVPEG